MKRLALALAALIVVFAIIVAVQPNDFRVTRSLSMPVAAPAVYAQVIDFHNWDKWSPWAKLDPQAKVSFDGPAEGGVGASHSWDGNDKVGAGRMTITDAQPDALIRLKLDFERPMKGSSTVEFAFTSETAQQTLVTWTMFGTHNFIEKAFCLFMSMDKMVGGDFEKGLAALKDAAASSAPAAAPVTEDPE
jgi:hypothetical protein